MATKGDRWGDKGGTGGTDLRGENRQGLASLCNSVAREGIREYKGGWIRGSGLPTRWRKKVEVLYQGD